MLRRVFSAGMLTMAAAGFGVGFTLCGLPMFDAIDRTVAGWAIIAVTALACRTLFVFGGRIESTWWTGWDAERRVGDLIEHAVVETGCAFAHDVKEALGGSGNVDHVVMTPAGVWVVETKAYRLSTRRFPAALGQAADNARRVRRHLNTPLAVRAALVIADPAQRALERDHDWKGEPVKVFDATTFWRVLRDERRRGCGVDRCSDTQRVERMVWDLGSSRHRET